MKTHLLTVIQLTLKRILENKNHLKFHHPEITAVNILRNNLHVIILWAYIYIYYSHRKTPGILFCNLFFFIQQKVNASLHVAVYY